MMAECYYWKGDATNEAAMLNVVRARAGAEPLSGNIGIAEVLPNVPVNCITKRTVMLNLFVFPICMLKPENPVKHWVDVSISWIISQDRVVSERTAKMPA